MFRQKRKRSGKTVEVGSVNIFHQIDSSKTSPSSEFDDVFQSASASVVFGESEGARFGSCVAAAGDLNDDGVDDFIVGAPLEGSSSGRRRKSSSTGAIYVFHGSRRGKIKSFSQRILPEDLDLFGIFGFGISLSTGEDMDGNGLPDVTVGNGFDQFTYSFIACTYTLSFL